MTAMAMEKTNTGLVISSIQHIASVANGFHDGSPKDELELLRDEVELVQVHAPEITDGDSVEYMKDACDVTLRLIKRIIDSRNETPHGVARTFEASPDAMFLDEIIAGDFCDSIDGEIIGGLDNLL